MRPPKDEIEDACARWGFAGAAEEYEVDEPTIIVWLRDAAAGTPPGAEPSKDPRGRKRGYDYELAAKLVSEGQTIRAVARQLGCSHGHVSHMARLCGVRQKRRRNQPARRKYDWALIRRLSAEGVPGGVIARQLECSPSTVSRVLARARAEGQSEEVSS